VNLIMTDRTLFGDDDEPAQLLGHGPIPAQLARSLVIGNADTKTTTWVRRLFTDPTGTQLVAMDSRRRLFPAAAQKFLILRDQTCRTPWCDAPIRHIDHITPYGRGGPTHLHNGQGLCQACNLSKQAPHWKSWTDPNNTDNTDNTVYTTTPTGHHYTSNPPTHRNPHPGRTSQPSKNTSHKHCSTSPSAPPGPGVTCRATVSGALRRATRRCSRNKPSTATSSTKGGVAATTWPRSVVVAACDTLMTTLNVSSDAMTVVSTRAVFRHQIEPRQSPQQSGRRLRRPAGRSSPSSDRRHDCSRHSQPCLGSSTRPRR